MGHPAARATSASKLRRASGVSWADLADDLDGSPASWPTPLNAGHLSSEMADKDDSPSEPASLYRAVPHAPNTMKKAGEILRTGKISWADLADDGFHVGPALPAMPGAIHSEEEGFVESPVVESAFIGSEGCCTAWNSSAGWVDVMEEDEGGRSPAQFRGVDVDVEWLCSVMCGETSAPCSPMAQVASTQTVDRCATVLPTSGQARRISWADLVENDEDSDMEGWPVPNAMRCTGEGIGEEWVFSKTCIDADASTDASDLDQEMS